MTEKYIDHNVYHDRIAIKMIHEKKRANFVKNTDLLIGSSFPVISFDSFGGAHSSREVQAVEELLLLLRVVIMAWNKVAKTITSLRGKARRVRRLKDKVC